MNIKQTLTKAAQELSLQTITPQQYIEYCVTHYNMQRDKFFVCKVSYLSDEYEVVAYDDYDMMQEYIIDFTNINCVVAKYDDTYYNWISYICEDGDEYLYE